MRQCPLEQHPLTQTSDVAKQSRCEVFGDVRSPGAFAVPGDRQKTTQDEKLVRGNGSIHTGLRRLSPCRGIVKKRHRMKNLGWGNGSTHITWSWGVGPYHKQRKNKASCSSMRRRALCCCKRQPVHRCLGSRGNARLCALCCGREPPMKRSRARETVGTLGHPFSYGVLRQSSASQKQSIPYTFLECTNER